MYLPFTDRARKVMQLANQEAQRLNHEYIGTEHILLGLIKEEGGLAAMVLKRLGIDLAKVRLEIERVVHSGPYDVKANWLPRTPRAKKVVEYSMEEVRSMKHSHVGTEHLLLGLIREGEGVAAIVLSNLGVRVKAVREQVLNSLGCDDKGLIEEGQSKGWELYSRFTPRAKRAMQLAYRQAARLRHQYIGTEHFLLAIIGLEDCTALDLLGRHNVNVRKLKSDIERLAAPSPDDIPDEMLPHTPRARNVIQFVIDESENFGHKHIGTEHVLLGLLHENESAACQVLLNHGLEFETIRSEVRILRRP
ncbi:MAG TPA: Clp protease N-terminal domain-containing protein [Gemmataceae bacterium]|jgi:ATP-dependent Clp protease ATP-binding subunit ClpA|nr:Clp protease N-terminal domain-containing protein [Gemmataceae bacterium]